MRRKKAPKHGSGDETRRRSSASEESSFSSSSADQKSPSISSDDNTPKQSPRSDILDGIFNDFNDQLRNLSVESLQEASSKGIMKDLKNALKEKSSPRGDAKGRMIRRLQHMSRDAATIAKVEKYKIPQKLKDKIIERLNKSIEKDIESIKENHGELYNNLVDKHASEVADDRSISYSSSSLTN